VSAAATWGAGAVHSTWRFTTADARIKLKRLHPVVEYTQHITMVIPIRDRNCDFDLLADAVYHDTIS
jgi:hypothetical protein